MKSAYQAGVCNIGPKEISKRKRFAWISLAATIILIAALFWFGAPRWTRILVILPAYATALGFLQASRGFCVYYGMRGLENSHDGTPKEASDPLDRAESASMMFQAFFLTGMVLLLILMIK